MSTNISYPSIRDPALLPALLPARLLVPDPGLWDSWRLFALLDAGRDFPETGRTLPDLTLVSDWSWLLSLTFPDPSLSSFQAGGLLDLFSGEVVMLSSMLGAVRRVEDFGGLLFLWLSLSLSLLVMVSLVISLLISLMLSLVFSLISSLSLSINLSLALCLAVSLAL